MYCSYDESMHRDERRSMNDFGKNGKKLLTSFMRKFTNGMTNSSNDKLYRTSTCCFSASIPTREVTHWVRIEKKTRYRSSIRNYFI
jgi:hypothetical protein